MPTLRQLRDRVKSLKNTQQITRAMKMVAGAKIRRADAAMRAARPYASSINEMLQELVAAGGALDHPLLRARAVVPAQATQAPVAQARPLLRRGVVLMAADKGLCGAFNSNLVRAAITIAAEGGKDTSMYVVGVKARVQLRRQPYQMVAFWALGSQPFVELSREIAARLTQDFLSGAVDALTLVSSRFVSTAVQRPNAMQLLPIAPPGETKHERAPNENAFEFEPDAQAVLAALLPKYLQFTIFQALLETQTSEFAARLLAMTNATDNAGKLIDEITRVMNATRQDSITKEILEISGGAEALKG
jgi:F-type H+-transporting ATPase subunit gamma